MVVLRGKWETNKRNYLSILGIDNKKEVRSRDVKLRFREIAAKEHPDLFVKASREQREEVKKKFQIYNEAKDWLSKFLDKKEKYYSELSASIELAEGLHATTKRVEFKPQNRIRNRKNANNKEDEKIELQVGTQVHVKEIKVLSTGKQVKVLWEDSHGGSRLNNVEKKMGWIRLIDEDGECVLRPLPRISLNRQLFDELVTQLEDPESRDLRLIRDLGGIPSQSTLVRLGRLRGSQLNRKDVKKMRKEFVRDPLYSVNAFFQEQSILEILFDSINPEKDGVLDNNEMRAYAQKVGFTKKEQDLLHTSLTEFMDREAFTRWMTNPLEAANSIDAWTFMRRKAGGPVSYDLPLEDCNDLIDCLFEIKSGTHINLRFICAIEANSVIYKLAGSQLPRGGKKSQKPEDLKKKLKELVQTEKKQGKKTVAVEYIDLSKVDKLFSHCDVDKDDLISVNDLREGSAKFKWKIKAKDCRVIIRNFQQFMVEFPAFKCFMNVPQEAEDMKIEFLRSRMWIEAEKYKETKDEQRVVEMNEFDQQYGQPAMDPAQVRALFYIDRWKQDECMRALEIIPRRFGARVKLCWDRRVAMIMGVEQHSEAHAKGVKNGDIVFLVGNKMPKNGKHCLELFRSTQMTKIAFFRPSKQQAPLMDVPVVEHCSSDRIHLRWTFPRGFLDVQQYQLQIKSHKKKWKTLFKDYGKSFILRNLQPDTEYELRIAAFGENEKRGPWLLFTARTGQALASFMRVRKVFQDVDGANESDSEEDESEPELTKEEMQAREEQMKAKQERDRIKREERQRRKLAKARRKARKRAVLEPGQRYPLLTEDESLTQDLECLFTALYYIFASNSGDFTKSSGQFWVAKCGTNMDLLRKVLESGRVEELDEATFLMYYRWLAENFPTRLRDELTGLGFSPYKSVLAIESLRTTCANHGWKCAVSFSQVKSRKGFRCEVTVTGVPEGDLRSVSAKKDKGSAKKSACFNMMGNLQSKVVNLNSKRPNFDFHEVLCELYSFVKPNADPNQFEQILDNISKGVWKKRPKKKVSVEPSSPESPIPKIQNIAVAERHSKPLKRQSPTLIPKTHCEPQEFLQQSASSSAREISTSQPLQQPLHMPVVPDPSLHVNAPPSPVHAVNLSFLFDQEENAPMQASLPLQRPEPVSKFAQRTPSPEPQPVPENVDVLSLLQTMKAGPRRKRKKVVEPIAPPVKKKAVSPKPIVTPPKRIDSILPPAKKADTFASPQKMDMLQRDPIRPAKRRVKPMEPIGPPKRKMDPIGTPKKSFGSRMASRQIHNAEPSFPQPGASRPPGSPTQYSQLTHSRESAPNGEVKLNSGPGKQNGLPSDIRRKSPRQQQPSFESSSSSALSPPNIFTNMEPPTTSAPNQFQESDVRVNQLSSSKRRSPRQHQPSFETSSSSTVSSPNRFSNMEPPTTSAPKRFQELSPPSRRSRGRVRRRGGLTRKEEAIYTPSPPIITRSHRARGRTPRTRGRSTGSVRGKSSRGRSSRGRGTANSSRGNSSTLHKGKSSRGGGRQRYSGSALASQRFETLIDQLNFDHYKDRLLESGFDSLVSTSHATVTDLVNFCGMKPGHANLLIRKAKEFC